jgi:ABC-type transporter Mla subunit MlaD
MSLSGGEIAGLIAAGAFLMLVIVLAVPILRLRHTVDQATEALRQVNHRTGPMLDNVNLTVDNVNTALGQAQTTLDGVNVQLARVDVMTQHVTAATANVANLVNVVTSTAANPLVKAAAFTYGVRKVTNKRKAADEEQSVRDELRARKRTRKG